MVTVSDDDLVRAMRFLWERMKVVVEPTGALGLAAALAGKVAVEGKKVGVVLSGGNVDLGQALALFERLPALAFGPSFLAGARPWSSCPR